MSCVTLPWMCLSTRSSAGSPCAVCIMRTISYSSAFETSPLPSSSITSNVKRMSESFVSVQ